MIEEQKDPIEELDEELKRDYGACPLCGRRMLAKEGEREWCKSCLWRPKTNTAG